MFRMLWPGLYGNGTGFVRKTCTMLVCHAVRSHFSATMPHPKRKKCENDYKNHTYIMSLGHDINLIKTVHLAMVPCSPQDKAVAGWACREWPAPQQQSVKVKNPCLSENIGILKSARAVPRDSQNGVRSGPWGDCHNCSEGGSENRKKYRKTGDMYGF